MPTFELTGPDGGTYQLDASDEHAAVAAFTQLHAGSADASKSGGAASAGDAAPSTLAWAYDGLAGIQKSAASGIVEGAAGMVGLPNVGIGLVERGMDWAINKGAHAFGLTTNSDRGGDGRSSVSDGFPTQERVLKPVEKHLYKPQNTAEEYARTVGEFIPGALAGPGSIARKVLAYGAAPAIASETAGQATKGTSLEPWARGGTAIAATLGAGLATGPAFYERMAARAAKGTTPEQFDQAAALARNPSFPIMASEAIQQATGGATQMGRIQRLAESTQDGAQILDPIMAQRPRQMGAATEELLDQIAPRATAPRQLGLDVQAAARSAVDATPEGRALAESIERAGPRRTADEAGAVIQPELRQVYERREGMRAALAEKEYDAARSAPEGIGIERSVQVERPGEPIVRETQPAYSRPQFEADAPRPVEAFERPGANGAEPGPESLARFIARNGGLRLDGDAAATDLHRFTIPGVGNVARPDGKSLDNFWRERLIEEGYFRPDADGGMARDISSELLRKLQNEQRGVPSYPLDAQGRPRGRAPGGQAADEYAAARSTAESRLSEDLTRVGIDPAGVHPDIRDRSVGALMRGEISDPLDAYHHVVSRMKGPPEPYTKTTPTFVDETIPDVRFGQANPGSVVEHIDRALESAKGPVAKALSQARETLFTRPGPSGTRDLDLSVTGLHNAREAIGDLIAKADPAAQRALLGVRERLDRSLSAVPEYEHARSGFEAASQNLGPFGTGSVPGRIVAQEQATKRFTMPREQAAPALDEGVSGVRDFNAVASPTARQAYEDYLTTRLLDGSSDRAGVSADGLARSLRDNTDLLREAPTTRERLAGVLTARDGMAPVEAAPIGQMAAKGTVKDQLAALLAKETAPLETREAITALQGQSDAAARGLVREGAGIRADETVHALDSRGRPDQYGGAKFARTMNSGREGANLRTAIDAVGGPKVAASRQELGDSLAATGWRQDIGTRTAFNAEDLADMKSGGLVGKGLKMASRPFGTVHDAASRVLLGRSAERLAQLIASGEVGVRKIQELQAAGNRGKIVAALAGQRAGTETGGPQR